MITRNDIIKELKKHSDKEREFKKSKIEKLIKDENQEAKLKILSDLESYAEY